MISVRGACFGYILLYDIFQKIFISQTTRRGRTWIGKGVLGYRTCFKEKTQL